MEERVTSYRSPSGVCVRHYVLSPEQKGERRGRGGAALAVAKLAVRASRAASAASDPGERTRLETKAETLRQAVSVIAREGCVSYADVMAEAWAA